MKYLLIKQTQTVVNGHVDDFLLLFSTLFIVSFIVITVLGLILHTDLFISILPTIPIN